MAVGCGDGLVVAVKTEAVETIPQQLGPSGAVRVVTVCAAFRSEHRAMRMRSAGQSDARLDVFVTTEIDLFDGELELVLEVRAVGRVTRRAILDGGLMLERRVGDGVAGLVMTGIAVLGPLSPAEEVFRVRIVRKVTGGALTGGERTMGKGRMIEFVAMGAHLLDRGGCQEKLGVGHVGPVAR